MKRYADNQRRAMMRGRNQAANDFESGNIGESEWMKSQTEVAQQTLETYGQMNGVDQKMIAVLQNVLQIQANQQATAANASNVLKGVLSVSKKSAQSMQAQIGSLN